MGSSIAAALAATSEGQVETKLGDVRLQWKVRRVNTADINRQGLATLLRAASPEVMLDTLRRARAKEISPEQAIAFVLEAADKEKLAEGPLSEAKRRHAMVAAGTLEARRWVPDPSAEGDGPAGAWSAWEPVRLTIDPAKRSVPDPERPDDFAGEVVLLVEQDLPSVVVDALYAEINRLTLDGGLAGERLASFLA